MRLNNNFFGATRFILVASSKLEKPVIFCFLGYGGE